MNSINNVTLSGRLGRDIVLRYTAGGKAIASFLLAVENSVKRGDQWETETSWIDATMFGKAAEWLARDSHKGSNITIAGYLKTDTWEKDGTKHSKTKVIAKIAMVGKDRDRSTQEQDVDQRPARPAEDYPDTSGEQVGEDGLLF